MYVKNITLATFLRKIYGKIMEERLLRLRNIYQNALDSGRVTSQRDFANTLGINEKVLSAAINGNERYLTASLLAKAMRFEAEGCDTNVEQERILVIPTGARAGTLADFSDAVKDYECERIVSPIRGADYAIQVTGDSMAPDYPAGAHLIIKRINEAAFVEWGKVYVLDTENGAVIKRILKTDDPAVVECVSVNPQYQPFTIPTKFIRGWYRVLMVLALK